MTRAARLLPLARARIKWVYRRNLRRDLLTVLYPHIMIKGMHRRRSRMEDTRLMLYSLERRRVIRMHSRMLEEDISKVREDRLCLAAWPVCRFNNPQVLSTVNKAIIRMDRRGSIRRIILA